MRTVTKTVLSGTLAIGIILNTVSFATEVKKQLTIDEAIKVGIENSELLELNKAQLETKKIELSQARSNEKKFRKYGGSAEEQGGFMLEEELSSKSTQYEIEEVGMKNESIKKQLELNISKLYYGVLQSKDMLKIEQENLKNLQENYNIVKKKFDLGTASKHDLNMIEIDLNNGKLEVDKSNDSYREVLRSLNKVLDYPLDSELVLTTGFTPNNLDIDLERDLKDAYVNRYDYVVANNSVDLARENFRVTQMSYTPNTYRYRLQNEAVKMAELNAKNNRKDIESDIKDNYDKITTAKREIEIMESNIKKAQEGVRVLKVQYDLNMATMLQVNEAQVGYNKAKLGKANAIGNYNTTLIDYQMAVKIGKL